MQLPLQDFGTLVKTQATAVKNASRALIDMSVGSVLRAILEANASVGLWMQWLIMQVLATTRAGTSNGVDLDTWVADFGMARLPASRAAGLVRFSRITPGLSASVPVGALVRTGTDASDQVFVVSPDPANAAWDGSGFRIAATDLGITVPVMAQTAGSAGNVRAGAVTQLSSAVPGVDAVVNESAFAGGLDAERDEALRGRFSGFLDSRTRATSQAVAFAVASVRQGLSFTIVDRVDASGATRAGHFTITLDDGSGAPSPGLISQVSAAVDAVRPIGGTFSVRPPLVIPVTIAVRVAGPPSALAAAQVALTAFVGALPIGAALVVSKLYQVLHDADSGIITIIALTVNGGEQDIVPPTYGLLRSAQVSVTL